MRKYAVALLAVPILLIVYVGSMLRRSPLARGGAAIAIGAIVAVGAIALVRPAPTVATPPTDIVPLTQAAFRTIVATGVDLDAAATIEFSTPMDRASVEAAIQVDPPIAVRLHWNQAGTALSIAPSTRWEVARYHTITVQAGALALTGRPLTSPARASFLTRMPAAAIVGATDPLGDRVAVDTAVSVAFDREVQVGSVRDAIRLDPPVPGAVLVRAGIDGMQQFVFTPFTALRPDTHYRLIVDGVRDTDGVEVQPATLELQTAIAPKVVRFRPTDGTTRVGRGATVSVRFTAAMDRASTITALSVTANGKAVAGKTAWAEGDTVLIFRPKADLPYGAKVRTTVATTATARDGTPLATTSRSLFRVQPKPAATSATAKTTTKATTRPRSTPPSSSGGSSSGGGTVGTSSWSAVERYYLRLMNCTRQGGWVDSGGHCDSPGGRSVAALSLSSGITTKVSRPYAKLLATRNLCSHFIGGGPDDRLARAGYHSYRWAENIGCRSGGSPYSAVLATHRFFQDEKSSNGGHYVNLMNAKYDRVGIGVWVSHGRTRLVIDFYHP